jgi:putative membrane protein
MIGIILHLAIVALGLWVSSRIVPGIAIKDFGTLVAAALLLGIVNALVRPVLTLLTLPITILTLGLFLIVVNAAMIGLVSLFLKGFEVKGFVPAVLCWIVVTVVSWIASTVLRA